MKKKYYYHLTSCNFGDDVVLCPMEEGENRADDEPTVKRICVGPSIPHCMISIYLDADMYVYRTKNRIRSSKCWGINDAHITKERWIRRPTKFIKYKTLTNIKHFSYPFGISYPLGNVYALGDGSAKSEDWQKQQLKLLKKLF